VPRFSGALVDVTDPITLRYRSVDHFQMDMMISAIANGSSDKTAHIAMIVEGSVKPLGSDLQWLMDFWMSVNSLDPKGSGDPVSVTMESNELGKVLRVELSGRNPLDGKPLRPGTPEYIQMSSDMISYARPMPREPITQGSDIYRSISKDELLAQFKVPPNVSADIDVKGIVQGLAVINDHTCVVVQQMGDIRMTAKGQTMTATISGYVAYDTTTALPIDGRIITDVKSSDGRLTMDLLVHASLQ
jgi:hypothetical protein